MKILIAYDGTECSDAAIADLRRAGLPAVAEVMVLSVAEISPHTVAVPYALPVASSGVFLPDESPGDISIDKQLRESQAFAAQAAARLRADFPGWEINTQSWAAGAGPAIIREARAWGPDLIVVGSHGRLGIDRFLLGSVSERVLHHVTCPVRISRHRSPQSRSIRILLGVDGSNNARAAVQAVATRNWPAGTEARAVGVIDSRVSVAAATTLEGTIPTVFEDECHCGMSRAVCDAAQVLEKRGLVATHEVITGHPADVLLAEAGKWDADCVFVGARGLNALERFLLGSVSTKVATHAHCSVEIVRAKGE